MSVDDGIFSLRSDNSLALLFELLFMVFVNHREHFPDGYIDESNTEEPSS